MMKGGNHIIASRANQLNANLSTTRGRILKTFLFFLPFLLAFNSFSQLNATFSNQKDACDGLENGSIDVLVTGSTGTILVTFFGPPNYNATPTDGNVEPITGLAPRMYVVVVQDATDTKVFAVDILNITPDLSASVTATTDNTDCSTPNGSITINVAGGTGAYSFAWTGPNGFTSSNQNPPANLEGGDYFVDIFDDGTNCSRSLGPITLTNPTTLVQTITTPSPVVVCPGVDIVLDLDGSELNKTYEILNNGVGSGFTSAGTGAGISITLPSGNFIDGDLLTIEGFEGICPRVLMNGTITVSLSTVSVAPTSATVDSPTYCDDATPVNISLTAVGGSLGTGATVEWYTDAAFATSAGAGNPLVIPAPLVSTTYFVRYEGTCNTTLGQSVSVTVDNASVAPTSATVDNANYCNDAAPLNITLTAVGGSLGTGATAEWYSDPAFATNVGTGSPLILAAPLTSTTYFVRYESSCGNTASQSIAVIVDIASITPTSATVDTPTYCDDAAPVNITLTAIGGLVGTGGTVEWYTDAIFTIGAGSGTPLVIPAPLVSTTYFVRYEGICNSTIGQNVSVTVDNASVAPTSATVDDANYCDDAAPVNITLTAVGGSLGTGATTEWYTDPAFTSNVGTGSPLILAAPLTSTTYFVRYESGCGNTAGQSIAVIVDNASVVPTSATVDSPTYCNDAAPANITLTAVGGSVGTGATVEWYTDAAFAISAGSGNPLVIPAPVGSTTYFVRYEGTCNTTLGQSISVTVDIASLAPTSATVDNANYCDDAAPVNITLTVVGGSLGTGATTEWYDDPAFTSNVGTGSPLILAAPLTSTTYFVRYESGCGNTTGQSIAVIVDNASVAPTSATVDMGNYCDDATPLNITLRAVGGSIGTGATSEWYTDAAFATSAGSGNPLVIPAPLVSTTYYVRFEGSCNTTADQSVLVTVDNASVAPTSASVDIATYCDDAAPANITLTAVGGSLGTGAVEEWYDDATFTSNVGNGSPLILAAPLVNTTYYLRYEGTCGNTTGQSISITVDLASTAPTSAAVDSPSYCNDAAPTNISLTAIGGNLGSGAIEEWYTDAAFTISAGSGNPLVIPAPLTSTTYFVRYEGACNTTSGQNVSVNVDIASLAPTSATVDNPEYCENAAPADITLSAIGGSLGTGATVVWYDDPGFTSSVGSGSPLILSAPSVSTTYIVRYESSCGNTTGQSVAVNVILAPDASISGNLASCINTVETYSVPAGATTYSWSLTGGTGVITSGAGTNSIDITWGGADGTDVLNVTVTGAGPTSCVATSVQSLGVFSSLPALSNLSTTTCQNSTFPTLVASPVSGAIVTWYIGSSATGTLVATGDTYTPIAAELDLTTPGITTYTYRQDIGCLVSTDATFDVEVEALPVAGSDNSIASCRSDTPVDLFTQLGGTPDSGGTWTDEDGSGALIGSLFDPSVAGDGIFNFTYVVDGAGSCAGESASAIVTVSVSSTSTSPIPDQTSVLGCTYAAPPTLTSPGIGLVWYTDAALANPVGSGNSFTPVDGSDIDMMAIGTTSYFVTQNEGCGESPAVQVDVVLEGVTAELGEVRNTYPEQDIGAIEVVNISSNNPPYEVRLEDASMTVIYDWIALEEDRLGNYSYLFTQLAADNYVVLVRDAAGCILPIDKSIILSTDVFIPNVFTPNNDGFNEFFKVLNMAPNTQIIISNRWGVKVFESDDYQNDWQAANQSEGVYYYTIKMAGVVYQGYVEVWRNAGPGTN